MSFSLGIGRFARVKLRSKGKDKKLLFTPRHDFFSLDAGALKENCFCPILGLAYSEIRPLCARLALVSGKRPALVQSSSRLTCAPVPSLSFIVNLGNGALSLGGLSVSNGSAHLSNAQAVGSIRVYVFVVRHRVAHVIGRTAMFRLLYRRRSGRRHAGRTAPKTHMA